MEQLESREHRDFAVRPIVILLLPRMEIFSFFLIVTTIRSEKLRINKTSIRFILDIFTTIESYFDLRNVCC